MKHVTDFIYRHGEAFLVTLAAVALTLANNWHLVSQFLVNQSDRIFIGITHYHEDYFFYLSQVTQGARGAWKVANLFTSENIPPQSLWWPNLILGKIAAAIGIPVWTVYGLSVITASALSLISIYFLVRLIYFRDRARRLAAFLIAVTTSTFYFVIRTPAGKLEILPHQFFYNYTGALNRLGGVFHLILQNILSVIMIVAASSLLNHFFKNRLPVRHFFVSLFTVSVSAFLLFYINPVYILVNGLAITVTILILIIAYRPRIATVIKLAVSGLFAAGPLVFPYLAMNTALKEPYFQYFRWWEANVKRVPPEEFFLSLGPIFILAVIGIIPFLRKFSILRLLGVIWTFIPLTLYFTLIPIRFQFPFFRLPQPPHYVIFAALATEALFLPVYFLKKVGLKKAGSLFFPVAVALWVILQIPPLKIEVLARNRSHALVSWLNHMDPEFIAGMDFLASLPDSRIVLAINNTELVVPALSGRTVYVGHHSLTLGYAEKIADTSRFFIRAMDPVSARTFLTENNIGYVVWRNEDGNPDNLKTAYPFLKTVFANNALTVLDTGL